MNKERDMNNELLSKLSEQGNKVFSAVQKVGELTAATASEVAEVQLGSLRTYSDMGADQLKVAAQVRDLDSLKTCLVKQGAVCRSVGEKALADTQILARKGMEYAAELRNIAKESCAGIPGLAA
jgi:phasin family protein